MANDFGARVERLERAAKAARHHALNLPPIVEVVTCSAFSGHSFL